MYLRQKAGPACKSCQLPMRIPRSQPACPLPRYRLQQLCRAHPIRCSQTGQVLPLRRRKPLPDPTALVLPYSRPRRARSMLRRQCRPQRSRHKRFYAAKTTYPRCTPDIQNKTRWNIRRYLRQSQSTLRPASSRQPQWLLLPRQRDMLHLLFSPIRLLQPVRLVWP